MLAPHPISLPPTPPPPPSPPGSQLVLLSAVYDLCAVGQLAQLTGLLSTGCPGVQLKRLAAYSSGCDYVSSSDSNSDSDAVYAAPPLSLPSCSCTNLWQFLRVCLNLSELAQHTHKHTHALAYTRTHCLSVKCAARVCVCECVGVAAAGQSPSCVMHPSNGEQAQ